MVWLKRRLGDRNGKIVWLVKFCEIRRWTAKM